jgi:hypothetical protein
MAGMLPGGGEILIHGKRATSLSRMENLAS